MKIQMDEKVRMCLDLLCILWIRELYFKVVTRKTDSSGDNQCVEIELQDVKSFSIEQVISISSSPK